MTVLALSATPALAGTPGGVAAAGSGAAKAKGKAKAKAKAKAAPGASGGATPVASAPLHASPVTARTPRIAYGGPVYQRLPSGEVVPYAASPAAGQTGSPTAVSSAAAVSSATGGSPVGAIAPGAAGTGAAAPAGSSAPATPELLVPGSLARYVDGLAAAPMGAPAVVQDVIWAANRIIGLPYIYGGGHGSFESPGYDCSGTVSFALHGGDLLATPEDSSEFMVWGSHGVGRWITTFSNPGHAYMTVAGMRLDTSSADDPSNQQGPRWRPLRSNNAGFTVRHPLGL